MPSITPIPLRIAPKLRARAEALVPVVAAAMPEHRITLAAVLRLAVSHGLEVLEARYVSR